MAEVNIFIMTAVIIWEIGSKAKCRELDNYMIVIVILSMMVNGKTTYTKEMVDWWEWGLIGSNMKGSLGVDICRDLGKCGLLMERDIRVNLEMICLLERVGCSVGMARFRLEYGSVAILCHNIDVDIL